MKKSTLIIAALVSMITTTAQTTKKWSQLSLQGGYDIAAKPALAGYVKDKLNGYHIGASYDYYFSWLGIGLDADYYKNKMNPYQDSSFTQYMNSIGYVSGKDYTAAGSAKDLTRAFIGIGPSFKWQTKSRFVAELNLRGGLTYTDGSGIDFSTKGIGINSPALDRSGDATGPATTWGTFHHKGYDKERITTVKGQLRLSYAVTPRIAINAGVYYNYYFGAKAVYNYLDWNTGSTPAYTALNPSFGLADLHSYGANAGVSYRLPHHRIAPVSMSHPTKNTITVLVKDEPTGQPLPEATVAITSANGVVKQYMTNSNGIATFEGLADGNYQAVAELHNIKSTTGQAAVDHGNNGMITLLHNDPRFTLQGKAVNINTQQPEGAVNVTIKDKEKGLAKIANSKEGSGSFSAQLDPNSVYEISGKKDSYISNVELVSTKGLTRSQTLYVQLEIGIEKVEVGRSIVLNKIFYDLDKADIREEASTDLDKLVRFLTDNPDYKVEIASHTDSRGSDSYNMQLSQKRAQNVVNYLTAKGINSSRLIAKGYGETKPVNGCVNGVNCSEAQYQQNRRTEFTLLGK